MLCYLIWHLLFYAFLVNSNGRQMYLAHILNYYPLNFDSRTSNLRICENHSLGLNYSTWRFPYIPVQRTRWFDGFNIQVLNLPNGHIGPTGRDGPISQIYTLHSLYYSSPPLWLQNLPQFSFTSIISTEDAL